MKQIPGYYTFIQLFIWKKSKIIGIRNSGPCRCNLIGWLWGLKQIIYMRANAALQVSGIICSRQVVQLMGYDFQSTYYNFGNVFFPFILAL